MSSSRSKDSLRASCSFSSLSSARHSASASFSLACSSAGSSVFRLSICHYFSHFRPFGVVSCWLLALPKARVPCGCRAGRVLRFGVWIFPKIYPFVPCGCPFSGGKIPNGQGSGSRIKKNQRAKVVAISLVRIVVCRARKRAGRRLHIVAQWSLCRLDVSARRSLGPARSGPICAAQLRQNVCTLGQK